MAVSVAIQPSGFIEFVVVQPNAPRANPVPQRQFWLADLSANPKSDVYNPAEAHKWYRVVAEYSEGTHSRALLAIARQHLDGLGVPCDVKMAKLWLRRLLQAVPQKSSAHREATKLLKNLDDQFL